jgi:hypothetical protein
LRGKKISTLKSSSGGLCYDHNFDTIFAIFANIPQKWLFSEIRVVIFALTSSKMYVECQLFFTAFIDENIFKTQNLAPGGQL